MRLKRNRRTVLLAAGALLVAGYLVGQYMVQDETRLFALDVGTGRVVWSTPLDNGVFSPAAGNERVFAYAQAPLSPEEREYVQETYGFNLAYTIKLCAFDAATGRQLWAYVFDPKQFKITAGSMANPPLADGNRAAVNLNEETLGVLDAGSGTLQWYFAPVASAAGTQSFTLAGDRLIAISKSGDGTGLNVQALDARSGASLWQANPAGMDFADISTDRPAVTANDRLAFVSGHNSVEAFDLQSGDFRFSVATTSRQLQVAGDLLYINAETSLLAVDAVTGAPRWTFTVPIPGHQSFLFGLQTEGPVTYIVSAFWGEETADGAWLFALNAADGGERWRKQLTATTSRTALGNMVGLSPVANAEAFLITREDENQNHALIALSVVDGSELWRFSLDAPTSPAINDNLVFVTDRAPRWRNWLTSLDPAWHAQS